MSDEQLYGIIFFKRKQNYYSKDFMKITKLKSLYLIILIVKENCNKALVMKKGRGIFFDDIDEAVKFYKSQEYIVY